jgi:beta-N-acetylglucosaminidase
MVMNMKKILSLIIILTIFNTCVYGAYTVDTVEQSGYTVDEEISTQNRYFKHVCTWEEIEQEEIILNKNELTFYLDDENSEFNLEAEVMPMNATNRKITYSSSNEEVASVDGKGKITTHNVAGDALITAKSGNVTARCKVKVVKAVTGVTLSQDKLQFYADRPVTAVLTAAVEPEDATIKGVEWSTDDASIAAVDAEGIVTPCGVGTTLISATTLDGNYIASCEVTVDTWEKRTAEPTLFYTDYSITLDDMVSRQLAANPTVFTSNTSAASMSDVKQYADPQNFTDGYDLYQFLDLSDSNGIDTETLNNYLTAKGVLEDKGSTFISAAKKYDVSEIYLAVHACLESGNGSSQLATGVEVEGVTVYNMFGIGAVDSDPVGAGAQYAYSQGWTTVDAAIMGGAEWISKNYINSGQNTLYKMRWNPDRPGTHQYATDVAWASKQAKTLKNMFSAFPNAELSFEFPIYQGQSEPTIKFD